MAVNLWAGDGDAPEASTGNAGPQGSGDPALQQRIIDLYRTYLGREPSASEVQSHLGNPDGINGVDAAIKGSEEYANRLSGGTQQSTVTQPSQETIDANPRDAMIGRDQQQWFNRLRSKAVALGFSNPDQAAQEELQGVINNASYAQNAGVDPEQFLSAAEQRLQQRSSNVPGSGDPTPRTADPTTTTPIGSGSGSGTGTGTGGYTGGSYVGTLPNGFGAPPAPFAETYETPTPPAWLSQPYVAPPRPDAISQPYVAPPRPDAISQPYVAPVWGEAFQAPTVGDLEADPGFLSGASTVQRGLERSAASRGSVLSGGFVGRTLPRALNDYAGTAYQNLYGRAFDSYRQRYGEFGDAASRDVAGRQVNENAYQATAAQGLATRQVNESAYEDTANRALAGRQLDENVFQNQVGNGLNAYNTRYRNYLDLVTNTRNAENDWWARENGLTQTGLAATTAGRPS